MAALRWCLVISVVALGYRARADVRIPDAGPRGELQQALAEFDQAQELQPQNPGRARQLLQSAAQRMQSVIASGVRNGYLEYNLGNCYLLAGDVGRAILHYRRAQRWIPRDPLLADNLREARSRRLVQIQPTRTSTVLKNAFFWHYDTSFAARTRAALACYILFWSFLAVRIVTRRRWAAVSTIVFGALTAVLACSVTITHWSLRNQPPGVITAMDVSVQKGPGTQYQRRFEQPLQPGVEFVVLERRGSWWRIELPDGQTGWIENTAGELVTTTSS